MEFETETQKKVYEQVAGWLKDLYPDGVTAAEDGPAFTVKTPRGAVRLRVNAWGQNDATIAAFTWVVSEIEHKVDLLKYLLRKNYFIDFGSFSLAGDGDITLQHTLIGTSCDKHELGACLGAILYAADRYDDEIIAKWGGKRAVDRVD